MRFLMFGIWTGLGAVLCVAVLLVIERTVFRQPYYGALVVACLGAIGVLLVASVVASLIGYRKLGREAALGYTSALGRAKQDDSLYFVNPHTLAVLAGPNEPRPAPGSWRR